MTSSGEPTPAAPAGRPSARYGSRKRGENAAVGLSGKIVAVVLVAMVILLVIFVAHYLAHRSDTPVSAEMTNYQQVSDSELDMWIDVTRTDTSQDSYCIVRALNLNMAEVGRRDVVIPAGGDEVTRWSVPITTRDAPVSGSVYGCAQGLPHHLTS